MNLNIIVILIVSMVCGKIARFIYVSKRDKKEEVEEDEQTTTSTTK